MIREYLEKSKAVYEAALANDAFLAQAERAAEAIHEAVMAGKRVYIAGNGGGAAEAQHFSAELLGKYSKMRKAFPAIALTTDTSLLTAWANDTSFDYIFSRQLEGLGEQGDIFVIFSSGGNSPNLVEALKVANEIGMVSIGVLGKGGGQSAKMCTMPVVVPSDTTAHIQEMHLALLHYFCEAFEDQAKTAG